MVVLIVLLILRGLLVPRSTLDMVREEKQQQVDAWRMLAEGRQQLIDVQQKQIDLLMGTAQTTERVLDAVSEAARSARGGDGRALVQAPEEQG